MREPAESVLIETAVPAANGESGGRRLESYPRWSLAFLGALGYLIVEYTRLPEMYPVLIPFKLGKVAVGLGLIGFILSVRDRSAARPPARGPSARIKIDVVLAMFVLSATFCSITAVSFDASANLLIVIFQWAVIYYLLGRVVVTPWRLRVFMFLFLLLNLKLAQFAIRGYFAGLSYWQDAAVMARFGAGAGSTGFFGNAGDFGVAMAVVWPLSGMLLFAPMKKSWRVALLVTNATLLGAVIFCGSRGALVGAAVAVLGAWLKNPKRIVGPVLAALLVVSIMYVLPRANKDRFSSALTPSDDTTVTIRLDLWKAGLKMFKDHPILGVGPGNFPSVYHDSYLNPDIQEANWAPHSIYIQAISELGLVGTVPVFTLWLMFFYMNFRTRKNLDAAGYPKRSFEHCLSLGLDLGLLGFLGSGAFITVLYYPHMWVLLGLTAGLHTASRAILAQKESADDMRRAAGADS